MSVIKNCAKREAAKRMVELHGSAIFRDSHPDYTRKPQQNLISGIEKRDFWSDLAAAAGNELVDGLKVPAKFCAAHSSSALAVNAFGPFRHKPEKLNLLGHTGFSDSQFERPQQTGTGGRPSFPDFYAVGADHVFCIESKFLEPLDLKKAVFAEIYERVIKRLAERSWADVYKGLKSDPRRFKYFDAAQMVKHYLGMRNSLGDIDAVQTLFYVYWEPTNAGDLMPFKLHRKEVTCFSEAVKNSQIKFMAQSYEQLWTEWESESTWSGISQHVFNLRERYDFSV